MTLAPWGVLLTAGSLVLGVVQFWSERDARASERNVRAWQLVTTVAPGNSGKKDALEYLHREIGFLCFDAFRGKLRWLHGIEHGETGCIYLLKPREKLVGIDLSARSTINPDGTTTRQLGAFLEGIRLPKADLVRANLSGSILFRADLSQAKLALANLSHANLREANLSGAWLKEADLRDTVLYLAKLSRAQMYSADLTDSDLSNTDLTNADLRDAILIEADLTTANLEGANLVGARLLRTDLRGATLTEADLTDADLTGADLRGAHVSDANMKNAQLGGADLSFADLSKSRNLTQEQLAAACGDEKTRLPLGFFVESCN